MALGTEHVSPDEDRRKTGRVNAIDANIGYGLNDFRRSTMLIRERTIGPTSWDSTARLHAANEIAVGLLLEFDRDRGLAINAGTLHSLKCNRW
ncbi:MAG: hypothetical protein LAO78_06430 [Acidobacteriia bacterium]|nr:hypothetical protein [Terriglobia bacterium]